MKIKVYVLCCIGVLVSFCKPILAQQNGNAFRKTLSVLALQAKIFIITEGGPLTPNQHEEDLKAILNSSAMTVEAKLNQIARLYDYTVQKADRCYILIKRYSDPADLPCITYDELEGSVRDLKRLTAQLIPPTPIKPSSTTPAMFGSGQIMYRFLKSLTPDQRAVAQNGGIRFYQLSSDQQNTLVNMLVYKNLNLPLTASAFVLDNLTRARTGAVRVEPVPRGGRAMGIRLPMLDGGGNSSFTAFSPAGQVTGRVNIEQPYTAEQTGSFVSTLADLTRTVNEKQSSPDITISVAPEISGKPVLFFGETNVDGIRVARAVSNLYALKMERRGDTVKIARLIPTTNGIPPSRLMTTLVSTLPVSIRRATYGNPEGVPVSSIPRLGATARTENAGEMNAVLMPAHAARWLRTTLAKPVESAGKLGVPFQGLSAKDQRALALFLSQHLLTNLTGFRFTDSTLSILKPDSNLLIQRFSTPGMPNRIKVTLDFGRQPNSPNGAAFSWSTKFTDFPQ